MAVGASLFDRREEVLLFVPLQEADAPGTFFLPAELWETVDIAHLMRFPQQLAKRCHLAIDGGVAVAAFAQSSENGVERLLRKDAELSTKQNFVDLADEGGHVIFVPTGFPEYIAVLAKKFSHGMLMHDPNKIQVVMNSIVCIRAKGFFGRQAADLF